MKTKVNITRRNKENNLIVIETKNLIAQLDETIMEMIVMYKKTKYQLQGNCFMGYIVID